MTMDDRLAELVEAAVCRALEKHGSREKPQTDPLMTTAELADYWNVSERTIRNLVGDGLPVQHCGDSPRFNREKCDAWAEARARSRS